MHATAILERLSRQGVTLSAIPGGKLRAEPRKALTDEARRLIRSHKRGLLAVLAEEARIRGWLRSIGEEDPVTIGEILEKARTDPEARIYYLKWAVEAERPAWWERVLGNTEKSVATLEPEEVAEAVRIGLLPKEIAERDVTVLAFRSSGAQALMMIPADRYDGLEVLKLLGTE
ncbi:MAG: hypothetical protein U9Q81_18440 [Pseudomonadota bacterium]|nr:hypothetical protein [Pseudomonadota bacterium]